jgi:micrococcal nuclease
MHQSDRTKSFRSFLAKLPMIRLFHQSYSNISGTMSRLFPAIFLACIIAGLMLAGGCTLQADDNTSTGHDQFTPCTPYPATVLRVIDGDTVRVEFPDGRQDTIRLLGVDTPELDPGGNNPGSFEGISDPLFLASWAEEASLMLRQEVEGREVFITTDGRAGERDRYGRILAYLSTTDGTDIGGLLLTRGLARVYTPESFAHKDDYLRLQQAAIQQRIGIWSGITPVPAATDGVYLDTVNYDAAGDDRFNLNDEYIVVGNGGGAPVDLAGWEIRDNGTVAFIFPEYNLGTGGQVTVRTGTGSPGQHDLFIGSGTPILNNNAGTVTLNDREEVERSRFSWG